MEEVIKILGVIALIIGIGLLLAFPVMWLWNWLMPTIFGLMKLTFWQSLGINLLCGFLFRSTNWK
ncbi:MAG TPA: hypothetical protein VI911_05915 [Patescibacteria group bacterium]|nr:hypothetical protein [Patescibacteria group bacterium]